MDGWCMGVFDCRLVIRGTLSDINGVNGVDGNLITNSVVHLRTFVPPLDDFVDNFGSKRLNVPSVPLDYRLQVLPNNLHRDGRVELDLATDQMLERNDAALPSAVALGIMLSPRRNLTRRFATLERVMPSVAAYQTGCLSSHWFRKASTRFLRCWM